MRNAGFAIVAVALLVQVACGDSTVAPGPDEDLPDILAAQGGPARVSVCHYNVGTDTWILMTLVENAGNRHLTMHDRDGQPGDHVPGVPGFVFDESCRPQPIEECPCFTLDDLRDHMVGLENLGYDWVPTVYNMVYDGEWSTTQFLAATVVDAPSCEIRDTRPGHEIELSLQTSQLVSYVCFHHILTACREFQCEYVP